MFPLPRTSPWWTFFPIIGLVISDNPDPLRRPLFGDATLLTRASLELLLKTPDTLSGEMVIDQGFSTYLGVRHEGIVNTEWFDEDRRNELFITAVRQRARELSGLITTAFLAEHPSVYLCGLAEYTHEADLHMVILKGDRSECIILSSHGPPTDTWSLNRYEDNKTPIDLDSIFMNSHIQGLFQAVSQRKSTLRKSLRRGITQACERFALAVYAPSYTSQVLGAITSMELLLTSDDQTTGFATLERRISALVGNTLIKKYALQSVLKVRHDYVHRGIDILDRRPPVQALGLAIMVLCRYAAIANAFRSKESLLSYLDLVITSTHVNDLWIHQALAVQPIAYDLLQSTPDLPFLKYVDSVLDFDTDYDAGVFDRSDRIYPPAGENDPPKDWDSDSPGLA